MGTSFDDIHSYALMSIADWRLDQIYTVSPANFNTVLDGWLIKSIPLFDNCNQELSYDTATRTFTNTLTLAEQTILSNLEILTWMDKQVLDVRQFSNVLNSTDFKIFSSAQNLTAKINAQEILRERVSQQMQNYGLKNVPWSDWGDGNFT
jgi:hypothetical protein